MCRGGAPLTRSIRPARLNLLVNLAKIEGVQVNVHQAKSQLSRLLQLVEEGERVIITRHGQPVAELAPARRKGFPFGAARKEPLVPAGDDWWQPMTDAEAEDWIASR